jgi:hypothetical protein
MMKWDNLEFPHCKMMVSYFCGLLAGKSSWAEDYILKSCNKKGYFCCEGQKFLWDNVKTDIAKKCAILSWLLDCLYLMKYNVFIN